MAGHLTASLNFILVTWITILHSVGKTTAGNDNKYLLIVIVSYTNSFAEDIVKHVEDSKTRYCTLSNVLL